LFESAIRLVGTANATGVIAAGAAFHTFAQASSHAAYFQGLVKLAAILFLLGVVGFAVAYSSWVQTTVEFDCFMRAPGEPLEKWEQIFYSTENQKKAPEEFGKSAWRCCVLTAIAFCVSLLFFMAGLATVIWLATDL
jgi:hypothetical protein